MVIHSTCVIICFLGEESLLQTLPSELMSQCLTSYLRESLLGFPDGSDGKKSACSAGDLSSIPGENPLEKEMATHSIILAWEIPWTEEPGGLQSMGSQRVGHD